MDDALEPISINKKTEICIKRTLRRFKDGDFNEREAKIALESMFNVVTGNIRPDVVDMFDTAYNEINEISQSF